MVVPASSVQRVVVPTPTPTAPQQVLAVERQTLLAPSQVNAAAVVAAAVAAGAVVVVHVVADGGDDVRPDRSVQQSLAYLVEEDDDVAHHLPQDGASSHEGHGGVLAREGSRRMVDEA